METAIASGFVLQSAATTGNGNAADVRSARQHVIYIIGATGVSSGAVQLESADDPTYAGTWVAEGSPVTVVADTQKLVAVVSPRAWVRARISTTVAGGSAPGVTVRLFAT